MNFDVVIATMNRPKSLCRLVNQILDCNTKPSNIIIVDSSDKRNIDITKRYLVRYFHTKRKNQPYQRYKGFLESKKDILIFFDDDIEIINKNCFSEILSCYQNDIVAVQPKINYSNTFLSSRLPNSNLRSFAKKNAFMRFMRFLSFNAELPNGVFGYSGRRGGLPSSKNGIEWFNGPVFSVKSEFLYKNFNFNLFNLYDRKLGKAEDAILGFTVSRHGKISYAEEIIFNHIDTCDSVYTSSLRNYCLRYSCSRLFLSLEFARLKNRTKILAELHFLFFMLGRIIGTIINQFVSYKKDRNELIKELILGFLSSLKNIKLIKSYIKKPKDDY